MPVFKSGEDRSPTWCELTYFDIVNLSPGQRHTFERLGKREKLVVGQGQCHIVCNEQTTLTEKGVSLDLVSEDGQFEVTGALSNTTLIRMCGCWGDQVGCSGLFAVNKHNHPSDGGDPVNYPKETNFDNHYHDCDEYWILFAGRGVVVSEGKHYEVGVGDCVATGMGHHHDFPQVFEPVEAVYFETTLERQKCLGHLWNHTYGKAQPRPERV